MRFFTLWGRKALVGAIVGGMALPVLAQTVTYTPATASPADAPVTITPALPPARAEAARASTLQPQLPTAPQVPLPAAYRNAPPDASTGVPRDAALGNAGLARLIALTRTHHPGRAQIAARMMHIQRGFWGGGGGNDAERRYHAADLARLDLQLAEEAAHALADIRAANAKQEVARVLDALAAQGLHLINQRVAAGLSTHAELERASEAAIKARSLAARAEQERGAAAARLSALTGVDAALLAATPAGDASVTAATPVITQATYPMRSADPADQLQRPEVRAALIRMEDRNANATELAALYREAVLKSIEDTENAYAAAVSARAQRIAAFDLAAAAARQSASLLAQLEAGRIGRIGHIEAETTAQEARLRVIDADATWFKALASLERALWR